MYLSASNIKKLDRIKRLNIINSVSGIKPGNLIGTKDKYNKTNLAIISSVVHLGSDPPYLGFILRPDHNIRRHTHENILENGVYTINHITSNFIEQAHYTSAKFEKNISEFNKCGFTEEYCKDFSVPFVKESKLKIGLIHEESVPIKSSNTLMIIGRILHLIIPDTAVSEEGYIDLNIADSVGIAGLNAYYSLNRIGLFPYARVEKTPNFNDKKRKFTP